jgi:hypothetical protein
MIRITTEDMQLVDLSPQTIKVQFSNVTLINKNVYQPPKMDQLLMHKKNILFLYYNIQYTCIMQNFYINTLQYGYIRYGYCRKL